jgi:hypothetical protein
MKDGKFVSPEGEVLPKQEVVQSLVHRCQIWTDLVLERYVTQITLARGPFSHKSTGKVR